MFIADQGVNIWTPEGGQGPLPSQIPGIAGWWEAWPGFGTNWTIAQASIPADITTWSAAVGVNTTANSILDNGGAGRHYTLDRPPTNDVQSYAEQIGVFQAAGAQQWIRFQLDQFGMAGGWINFDIINAVVGNSSAPSVTGSITKVGSIVTAKAVSLNIPSANRNGMIELLNGDDAGGAPGYIGAGTDGINAALIQYRQERLTQLNDLSGNAAHATDLAGGQGPLFQDTLDPFSWTAVPLVETSRNVILQSVGAPVLACFNVASAAHTTFGVARLDVNGSRIYECLGAGAEVDELYCNGAIMTHNRVTAAGAPWVTNWPGAFPGLGVPFTYALILHPVNGYNLWINGVDQGAAGPAPIAIAGAATYSIVGRANVLDGGVYPANAILPSPGLTNAQIYTLIQPSLLRMGARWGGLPA